MKEDLPETGPPQSDERGSLADSTAAAERRARLRALRSRVLDAPVAWSVLFAGVLLLIFQSPADWLDTEVAVPGQVAPHDMSARSDFDVFDPDLTAQRRKAAEESVPDVYVHDTQRANRMVAEVARLFEEGRRALNSGDERSLTELRVRAGADPAKVLESNAYSRPLESLVSEAVERGQSRPVVGNRALLEAKPAILVVQSPSGREETLTDFAQIVDLDTARRQVEDEVERVAPGDASERAALAALAASFVDASLAFDPDGTARRRASQSEAVVPVRIRVPAGTVLVRRGQRWTPESVALLEASRRASAPTVGLMPFFAVLTILALFAFFVQRYARYHQRGFRKLEGLHALLVQVMLGTLLLTQAILWIARGLIDDLGAPFNRVESYPYLVPVGAGAILVALLANGRIASAYSAFVSVLFGALTGWDGYHMAWAFLAQLGGVYAVTSYRERAALLRAGLAVGGAGALAAAAVEVLRPGEDAGPRALLAAALSLLGGAFGVGLLVSFILPLFERMFNVLTDVRLLELSNVDHPLLSELARKAPGSYSHSLVVGTLAQEAAKAVGANPLFCRVAALYHDIGKLQKPDYYVENQQGENPHDHLTPSMSALVLASHVKDGVRMAREAGLPEQIIDIIPQHHGTRLMTYFLEKARRAGDPTHDLVRAEDFRYPGPKPASPEAAIFMLADAVEAAARTVSDPTPDQLHEVIRHVTDAVVLDRQLDECELTFADLERIQAAFLRTLLGTHHHRPEYPGYQFGRARGPVPEPESPFRKAAGSGN